MIYPYRSSDQAISRCAGIEAVDYFLAVELEGSGPVDPLRFHLWMALSWALREGHSCLPLAEVAVKRWWSTEDKPQGIEGQNEGYLFPGLDALQRSLAPLDLSPEAGQPVVFVRDRLWLRRYWQFEQEVREALQQRMRPLPLDATALTQTRALLTRLFPAASATSGVDWQAVAVANSVNRAFAILSGGPGTGKTYTVARLLVAIQALNGELRVAMAAPTGKAAQRLQESIVAAKSVLAEQGIEAVLLQAIPTEAKTLHRLLGIRPDRLQPRYHAERKLPVDLLLVDEASMVDLPMMARLLRALPDAARLILVGDANQLPSIEVSALLADLAPLPHPGYSPAAVAQIQALTGHTLTPSAYAVDHLSLLASSRRFDEHGGIGLLAKRVIETDADGSWQLLQSHPQCAPLVEPTTAQISFVDSATLEQWLSEAVQHYYQPLVSAPSLEEAFVRLAAFRILLATRQGDWGVESLNARVEGLLARQHGRVRPGHPYQGRPIMVTRNNPDLGVYNGDVGLVWPNGRGGFDACFECVKNPSHPEGVRRINLGLLNAIEPVYAMTIHKTQGSEFDHVAVLLMPGSERLLSPELIYTAITRARNHCYLSAPAQLWRAALAERRPRWSGLSPAALGLPD